MADERSLGSALARKVRALDSEDFLFLACALCVVVGAIAIGWAVLLYQVVLLFKACP